MFQKHLLLYKKLKAMYNYLGEPLGLVLRYEKLYKSCIKSLIPATRKSRDSLT